MNANKSFTFPTSLFLHTVLRPRNNGQLPEMDMRTGNPFARKSSVSVRVGSC